MIFVDSPQNMLHSPRSAVRPPAQATQHPTNRAVEDILLAYMRCLPTEQAITTARWFASSYSSLGLRFSTMMSMRCNQYDEVFLTELCSAPRLLTSSFPARERLDTSAVGAFKMWLFTGC